MCYSFSKSYVPDLLSVLPPYGVPMGIQTFAPLMGKVLTKRDGNHISSQGMIYDLRKLVADPNAVIDDHDNCIHLLPGPDESLLTDSRLSSHGSHILATVPSKNLWGKDQSDGRCWHTDANFPIVCLTCEGIDTEVLALPEFRRDMGMQPLALPPGLKVVGYDPMQQKFQKVNSDNSVDPAMLKSFYRSLN